MTKNWYPVIDYKKCIGCMACVDFCPHGVYIKKNNKPFVKNPKACIDQCTGCEPVCPVKAITHHGAKNVKKKGCNCSCKSCGPNCKC
ncbi:MAG: 4Fe-4S dicluster domain-containing protein [Candidatus Aenigmarchaeota archaeon]|nr:4Fe-4S dicluster domain-containing protein [Candidatus Aenigmarchaeota archaeon]